MSNNGGHVRPKGFMTWKPKQDTQVVMDQVQEILREYRQYLPLTVRQVFYRLVGNYGYEKTERAYKRLCEYMVKARRSQMIPFGAIRDDGGSTYGSGYGFKDMYEFMDSLAEDALSGFGLDPKIGQPYEIIMFCEAGGMAPMLANMVSQYGISVTGTGGFSSLTTTYGFARKVLRVDKPTYFLHVGDYDPSGESIFTSMSQDIGKFVAEHRGAEYIPLTGETKMSPDDDGPDFRPIRVALTEDQVEKYDLPTAPPKPSDTRSARWVGETTQAEALPPTLLEELVQSKVEELFDMDQLAKVQERQAKETEIMGERLEEAVRSVSEEIRSEQYDEGDEE